MYADIPWVLATGGQKGELAIWDTEEDKQITAHFKDKMPEKARQMKKKADKGHAEADADMADGEWNLAEHAKIMGVDMAKIG